MLHYQSEEGSLLSTSEAAAYLLMRQDTLVKLANMGRIPHVRIPSPASPVGVRGFTKLDLDAYNRQRMERLHKQIALWERIGDEEASEVG